MARFIFLLTAILFFHKYALCAPTELRVAAQENSPPKFIHQGNEIAGFCIDAMRAIERKDPELKFVGDQSWLPPKRIIAMLETAKLDVACGITQSNEMDNKFHLLRPALFSVTYLLAARSDDNVQIRNWDDVTKLGNQGVVLGVTGMSILHQIQEQNNLIVIASDALSVDANLHMLAAKRGRFFFYREPGLRKAINDAALAEKIKVLPGVMVSADLYMLVRKDLPPAMKDRLTRAITDLKQSGEFDKILTKWSD